MQVLDTKAPVHVGVRDAIDSSHTAAPNRSSDCHSPMMYTHKDDTSTSGASVGRKHSGIVITKLIKWHSYTAWQYNQAR